MVRAIRTLIGRISVVSFGLLVAGCGPSVRLSKMFTTNPPEKVLLLPPDVSSDIPRERVQVVSRAVESSLRNRGFAILDSAIVSRSCSTSACAEQEALAATYQVDAISRLHLNSVSRNNFLAGYYNVISGDLSFSSPTKKDLGTVHTRESEQGGILFQTGQLVQGVLESTRNSVEGAFSSLAQRFARALTQSLPSPATGDNDSIFLVQPQIQSVTTHKLPPNQVQICVVGSPGKQGYVSIDGIRTNLREFPAGHYCGVYLADSIGKDITAELQSPYGSLTRSTTTAAGNSCPGGQIVPSCSGGTLRWSCSNPSECSNDICNAVKAAVFVSAQEEGPYKKLADFRSSGTLHVTPRHSYAVVVKSADGRDSVPTIVPASSCN